MREKNTEEPKSENSSSKKIPFVMPFSGTLIFITSGLITAGGVIATIDSMKMHNNLLSKVTGSFVSLVASGVFYKAGEIIGNLLIADEEPQLQGEQAFEGGGYGAASEE